MERVESRKNKLTVHFRKLASDPGYRRQTGEMLCEGPKLLKEALISGFPVISVLASDPDSLLTEEREMLDGCRIFQAPEHIITYVSDVKTPQGIVFSCKRPDTDMPEGLDAGAYIILDGIQDPGNMGTIIRTAAAFGIKAVILTGPSTDPYGPKAVRASMGAVFRQRIIECSHAQAVETLRRSGIPVYSAENKQGAITVSDIRLKNAAAVIGNEGNGITAELRELCDGAVRIPVAEECESLNAAVAAAIIMYEMGEAHVGA